MSKHKKMIHIKASRFLLLIGMLLAGNLFAVEQYDVELIVFERTSRAAIQTESWPQDPGKPDTHNATQLATKKGAYLKLPSSKRTLTNVAKRMHKASGRPVRLTHMMWRQPAVGSKDAIPVIVSGTTKTGKVTGIAKVSVRRYLHLNLDLLLETTNGPAPGRFRMQAHRRMRSGQLHYLDHPAMGALIRITPVKR